MKKFVGLLCLVLLIAVGSNLSYATTLEKQKVQLNVDDYSDHVTVFVNADLVTTMHLEDALNCGYEISCIGNELFKSEFIVAKEVIDESLYKQRYCLATINYSNYKTNILFSNINQSNYARINRPLNWLHGTLS